MKLSRQINPTCVVTREGRARQSVRLPQLRAARAVVAVCALFGLAASSQAADLTVREIAARLHKATPGTAVDLAGHDLAGLDFAGLDFKGANLAHAKLGGADLTGTDMSGANLAGASLDRSVLIKTSFRNANLAGASIVMPALSAAFDIDPADAPSFAGANLTGVRFLARMRGADLSGATFAHANLAPHESVRVDFNMLRTTFSSCNLKGTDFSNADLSGVLFEFADLRGANFTNANLTRADMSHADLRGAKFDGATLVGADLADVDLTGVTGLETAKGLEHANLRHPD